MSCDGRSGTELLDELENILVSKVLVVAISLVVPS